MFDFAQSSSCRRLLKETSWATGLRSPSYSTLSESFDSLSRPMPRLSARKALAARNFLHTRLREFHMEHRDARVKSVAHGINIVAHSDPCWENNPDYYNIEMVSALGLLATPSTLSVWLLRHLLTAPEVLDRVVEEVKRLGVCKGEAVGSVRLDLADVRTLCPWLVASWYETLRLHMTGVPRLARHDFTLSVPGCAPLSLTQGDVILLPMCASNLDAAAWGPETAFFRPERFLTSSGALSASQTRRVKAFGVAGNLCPGRAFGFDVAMGVTAGMLRMFEVRSVDGRTFEEPRVKTGFNVGFERVRHDVRAVLVRRDV